MLKKAFKIKFRGHKIAVRQMAAEETIGSRCLVRCRTDSWTPVGKDHKDYWDNYSAGLNWQETRAQGDLVGDHPNREYVEIMSQWFKL